MSAPTNKHLLVNLVEFGLSDKEATMYIALLEFEIATVNQIAKASGINRSSAYVVLEGLKKKGLVSISDDKNVQQYIPTSPSVLLKTAETMANKQDQIKKNISAIIPDLKALHRETKQKPVVRVFTGKDGLISLFEDTLTTKEKLVRVATSLENLTRILPQNFFSNFLQSRYKNKIKLRGIHPKNDLVEELLKSPSKSFDDRVIVPENNFKLPSDFMIYDNKITYMSHQDGGVGVLIESKEMSDVMKKIFDLAFIGAKHTAKSRHVPPR